MSVLNVRFMRNVDAFLSGVEISCRGNEAKLCLHTQSKSKLNLEFSLRGMKRKQGIKTDAEANVKRSSVRFTSRFAILNKLASEMI